MDHGGRALILSVRSSEQETMTWIPYIDTLYIVMPAYNESEGIIDTINQWSSRG